MALVDRSRQFGADKKAREALAIGRAGKKPARHSKRRFQNI